jgi:hypothetical protein
MAAYDITQEGTVQISGPGARDRCIEYDHYGLYIDFPRPFRQDPQVQATAWATNSHDSVFVEVAIAYGGGRGMIVYLTTKGQRGREICDSAYVHWKAYGPVLHGRAVKAPARARRPRKR